MDRRTFIAAAPAVAIAPLAGAETTDPHMAWIAEWEQLIATIGTLKDDGPLNDQLWDAKERISYKIVSTQAETLDGVRAQLAWFRSEFDYVIEEGLVQPFGGALKVIEAGLKGVSA